MSYSQRSIRCQMAGSRKFCSCTISLYRLSDPKGTNLRRNAQDFHISLPLLIVQFVASLKAIVSRECEVHRIGNLIDK